MSASAFLPTAPTTLVVVLGASAWPNSPGFQASEAFVHAAQEFRNYLLDPHGFGLPEANLLDQFDAQTSASDQLEVLASFLEERTQAQKAANQAMRDVLVYFVGHGGFAGPSADFYLMHRRANASSLRASGMAIDALAEVLLEKARHMRRYLFLDCCFSAVAFIYFQGGPDQVAITKTLDVFHVRAEGSGFPTKGTVLLCSSDHKSPSLLLPDESCTIFSHALLDVLRNGDPHRPYQLSLRDIKELAQDRLSALPEKNAPRPGLYSPDQSEGDVADVPFFPNFSARRRVEEERLRRVEEERLHQAEEERDRKAQEQLVRQIEEGRRRQAECEILPVSAIPPTTQLQQAQQPPMSNIVSSPLSSSMPTQAAIPSQSPASLPHSPTPALPRQRREPAVVLVRMLLALLLLGGGGIGVYRAATGMWLWNTSHGQSTPTPSGPSAQANATATAQTQANATATAQTQANATATAQASVPGQIWHPQNTSTSQSLCRVAWTGSQFVVTGLGGTILTSPDGRTWTPQNSGTSITLCGVAWSGSQFVVTGLGGTILTSPDGRTWMPQNSGTSAYLRDVVWSGSQFVAVGEDSTILTSPDGRAWTPQNSGSTQQYLRSVAWSGSQFVVVGGNMIGMILTSPNGQIWTTQISHTSHMVSGVAWLGSRFVVVGDSGTILTSPDGRAWTPQNSGTSDWLEGAAWSGLRSVIVGGGTILASPDGRRWTLQYYSSTPQEFADVAWSGSRFVVVGMNGTILTSP